MLVRRKMTCPTRVSAVLTGKRSQPSPHHHPKACNNPSPTGWVQLLDPPSPRPGGGTPPLHPQTGLWKGLRGVQPPPLTAALLPTRPCLPFLPPCSLYWALPQVCHLPPPFPGSPSFHCPRSSHALMCVSSTLLLPSLLRYCVYVCPTFCRQRAATPYPS